MNGEVVKVCGLINVIVRRKVDFHSRINQVTLLPIRDWLVVYLTTMDVDNERCLINQQTIIKDVWIVVIDRELRICEKPRDVST